MATGGSQNPISAALVNRMLFGAGAIYANWGVNKETLLGTTRGGAEWRWNPDVRQIEADGISGPTQGLKRVITQAYSLSVTFLELKEAALNWFLYGSNRTHDAQHIIHRPGSQVIDALYIANVALVAEASATTPGGDPYVLMLENALPDGEMVMNTEHNNEGLWQATFMAHYTMTDQSTPPFKLYQPKGSS